MPFTLSHAAAVIPFRRTRLVMSALVMGCFVPDFSYLLSLSKGSFYGHTLPGIFVLDLPLALASLWLFHTFLKQPMLLFLPGAIRRRLTTSITDFPFWPLRRFLLILLSILIGTATHILWDSFTHAGYWFYHHWEFMRYQVQLPVGGHTSMVNLLEYVSSVAGVLIVAIWIVYWYRTTPPSPLQARKHSQASGNGMLLVMLPALSILLSLVRADHALGLQRHLRSLVHFTAGTVISAISFFLLGLLIWGVFLRLQKSEHVRV